MFFLSKLSLANRSIVALAAIGVILFGIFVIPSLQQELLPSLAFPAISVISVYPGASPSIVEQAVTDPLEQNIQGVPGLQHITSYSNEGTSIITVQYDFGTDLNQAAQTITQRINKAQASLPANVTPQVQTFDISSQPIIQLAVTSSGNQQDLALSLKQNIVPILQGLNGVANVNLTGVRNQIVTVTLDPQKLQQHGLSVAQVQNALQANNTTLPAGEVTIDGQTLAIRVGNTFNSIQDLENVVVGTSTTQPSASGSQQSFGSFSGAVLVHNNQRLLPQHPSS